MTITALDHLFRRFLVESGMKKWTPTSAGMKKEEAFSPVGFNNDKADDVSYLVGGFYAMGPDNSMRLPSESLNIHGRQSTSCANSVNGILHNCDNDRAQIR